jgi:hypothetical protein
MNVTFPAGVLPEGEVMVDVNVTDCPYVEVVTEDVNAVAVPAWFTVRVTMGEVLAANAESPA